MVSFGGVHEKSWLHVDHLQKVMQRLQSKKGNQQLGRDQVLQHCVFVDDDTVGLCAVLFTSHFSNKLGCCSCSFASQDY